MLQTVWTDDIPTDDEEYDELTRRNDSIEEEWTSGKVYQLNIDQQPVEVV
jgi:hypothetical protein